MKNPIAICLFLFSHNSFANLKQNPWSDEIFIQIEKEYRNIRKELISDLC